jgi:hypothetical protein
MTITGPGHIIEDKIFDLINKKAKMDIKNFETKMRVKLIEVYLIGFKMGQKDERIRQSYLKIKKKK